MKLQITIREPTRSKLNLASKSIVTLCKMHLNLENGHEEALNKGAYAVFMPNKHLDIALGTCIIRLK